MEGFALIVLLALAITLAIIKKNWITAATGGAPSPLMVGMLGIGYTILLAVPFVALAFLIKPDWFLGDPRKYGRPEIATGVDTTALLQEYRTKVRVALGLAIGVAVIAVVVTASLKV
jgi:hypothetical protein